MVPAILPGEIKMNNNDLAKIKEIELHKRLSSGYAKRHNIDYSRLYHDYLTQELLSMMPKKKELRVLDLGCGSGIMIKELATEYEEVVGLDISASMLRKINLENYNNITLIQGDAESPPFKNNSFDVIICRGTLHHLQDVESALKNLNKILNTNGIIISAEPCNDFFIYRWIRNRLYRNRKHFTESHKSFQSKEIKRMHENTGYKIIEQKYFGYLGFPICGFPDIIEFRYLPFKLAIVRLLIRFDNFISQVYGLRMAGWLIITTAKKYKISEK
jgi:ubiquinone/menaquinone biosynthesis C-methylase UbiE